MARAITSRTAPAERVRHRLETTGYAGLSPLVPHAYERLGDVLVLPRVEHASADDLRTLARAYAHVLGSRAVLVRTGPVEGPTRRPGVAWVWGDTDTTTTVTQHGVQYRFDPQRVMFSAGNVEERARMGRLETAGQTVVDLFAGLGYLSLPMAVHGRPARVVACEINPEAAAFLAQNARLNGVEGVYEVRHGDCRERAPTGVADRVLMGYLHDTHDYVPTALAALRLEGGTIHFHFKAKREDWPGRVAAPLLRAAGRAGRTAAVAAWRRVKSYAPVVDHGVLDVEVGPA